MALFRRLIEKFSALFLLAFLAFFYFITIRVAMPHPALSDFGKFYASAQFLHAGQDIYSPVAIASLGPLPPEIQLHTRIMDPNLNLPIVTALFTPLTFLDYSPAFMLWSLLSLFSGLAAVQLVARTLAIQLPRGTGPLWLAVMFLSYYPTWGTIRLGQVSLFLFLLLALGWAAAREGKDRRAGLAIGLALLLKVFVLAVIPLFLACKRWRLAAWSLGTFAVGIFFSLAAFGLEAHRSYLKAIAGITWYDSSWNASLLGFFSRIFGGAESVPAIDAPWIAKSLWLGISLVLFAGLIRVARSRRCGDAPQSFDLAFGLSLTIMLLAAPLGWMYYFPALHIAFLAAARRADAATGRWKIAVLAAFALSTLPIVLVPGHEIDSPLAWFTWAAIPFCALALLTAGLFAAMHDVSGSTSAVAEPERRINDRESACSPSE